MHFLIKLLTTFAVIFFGLSALHKNIASTQITTLKNITTMKTTPIKPPMGDRTQLLAAGPALTHTDEIDSALAEGGEPIVADVLGVVCDFCALAMNKIFSKREEVAAIYVDLDTKALSLVLVPSASLSDDTIAELAVQAGYRVADIRRGDAALGSGA